MSCNVGEVTEMLENEQNSFSNLSITSPTSQLILQPFCSFTYITAHFPTLLLLHLQHKLILQLCHFTYITTHSPTLLSLYLHHSSFSNPSVASPMSQFIPQPFFRFSYVISSSLNSPGKPPMPQKFFFN